MIGGEVEYTNVKWVAYGSDKKACIKALRNGKEIFVPVAEDNTDYIQIMAKVDAGTLTIEAAD